MSERGIAMTQNDKEAFQWYLKAAELGHAKAQYKVADAYLSDTGVEPNEVFAKQWFSKSATQGNLMSQAYLKQ